MQIYNIQNWQLPIGKIGGGLLPESTQSLSGVPNYYFNVKNKCVHSLYYT